MLVQSYKFDNQLFEDHFRVVKLELKVTKNMIQSVIDKSERSHWKIQHIGIIPFSNKLRFCSLMTIELPACLAQKVIEKLEIKTDKTSIDFYRSSLEKIRTPFIELRYWVFNARSKRSELKANTPFMMTQQVQKGEGQTAHFLAKKLK